MSKRRFYDFHSSVRYRDQPAERPAAMSSERYRWHLIDDFVRRFNEHRLQSFSPLDIVCVDESMSKWYGAGGHWINECLPMYVVIDRNPENACKIQISACGPSGVMLRLKLVTTAEDESARIEAASSALLHGTKVLKELVMPWARTGRIVGADSYFASVESAEELYKAGLRFIGVLKTATRRYPMSEESRIEFGSRGDRVVLLSLHEAREPWIVAFTWVDRDRRYFV
jgi:Transposase IS4